MIVLLSTSVFPGTSDEALDGFVAVEGNRIVAVGERAQAEPWAAQAERVIDCGDGTIMAGLCDDHTFFSGWALTGLGADLSGATDGDAVVAALREWAEGRPEGSLVLGHGLPDALAADAEAGAALLTGAFPDRPAVAFTQGRDTCWLNRAASERYGFSPDACWSEMLWAMMPEYLAFPETPSLYRAYQALLNERGVTAVKEMSFDDYYGFVGVMKALEDAGDLTLRVQLQSQPVGRGADLGHGRAMREQLTGPFLSFGGYNRMTDRGMASELAEMIEPYASDPSITVREAPEWGLIEEELAAVDAEGFRYTLHCQGDGAVRKTVDLYDRVCQKDEDGRLVNRHAITDLESTQAEDLERFGAMGGICEVYPQIQSLDNRDTLVACVDEKLGHDRFAHFWQRRAMADAGCTIACGTDLPLLTPSLGDSLWCGVAGRFADGKAANEQNMLTVPELLRAWTAGSAYDCHDEERLGTLEPGKLADLIVLDRDVLAMDPDDYRDLSVALTMSDGRIVHQADGA